LIDRIDPKGQVYAFPEEIQADLKTISTALERNNARQICSFLSSWQPVFASVGDDLEINDNSGQREMLHVLRKKEDNKRWPKLWAALSRVKTFVRRSILEDYAAKDQTIVLASGSLLADRAITKGHYRLSQDLHTDVDYRSDRLVYGVIIPLDSRGVELWVSLTD